MSNTPPSRRGPVVLVVLDGWGYRAGGAGNAIELASTPTWHKLWAELPAHPARGVGSLRRPAGRPDGELRGRPPQPRRRPHRAAGHRAGLRQHHVRRVLRDPGVRRTSARGCKARGGTLHLFGLLGNGGVHALDRHLVALLDLAARQGVPRSRSTAPPTAATPRRTRRAASSPSWCRRRRAAPSIATLAGRYYMMDRDKRWPRTQLAYDAMMFGAGTPITDPVAGIEAAYARGETDEFIKPLVVVDADGRPVAPDPRRRRRSSASTSARTGCGRWCAPGRSRTSRASTGAAPR